MSPPARRRQSAKLRAAGGERPAAFYRGKTYIPRTANC